MNLIMARAAMEALIFASSEPVSSKTISEITGVSEHTVKQMVADLMAEYADRKRGIQLIEVANGYHFCTHPECAEFVEKLQKSPRNVGLSQAAIETLAIIAYKQPLTKAEIEALRGVRAESAIATLVEKNLIEEVGRKDVPGKPILYGTTKLFLKYFGLSSLEDLPQIPEWIGSSDAAATANIEQMEDESNG